MPKYIVRDGLFMRGGGPLYNWWLRNRGNIIGQPALDKTPPSTPAEKTHQVVMWAHWGLENRGHFIYTQTSMRSQMFHQPPGSPRVLYADCSQWVAAILHWVGVKKVTDTDDTATLLQKGTHVKGAAPARVAIWGPGGGDHAAFITEKAASGDWWTIGFGHQGAPDRVLLSVMNTYFREHGKPGVRFLDFL
jgi:hypothetical protein